MCRHVSDVLYVLSPSCVTQSSYIYMYTFYLNLSPSWPWGLKIVVALEMLLVLACVAVLEQMFLFALCSVAGWNRHISVGGEV